MNYLQRKKRAFMSIVNSIKGFVRNIMGVPPITLEDCVDEESVINYQIYGNSTQTSEPSPDAPVEVVSVGEYDEETGKYKIPVTARGKNLLNEDLFLDESNWSFNEAGDQGFFYLTPLGLEVGKKYTIMSKCTKSLSMSIYRDSTYLKGLGNGVYCQFTYSDDIYLRIYIPGNNSAKIHYYKVRDYYQLMIVEGTYTDTTIGEYEPYKEPITTNIYLDEPLRKVGDYADYVDFQNDLLVRNVFETEFIRSGSSGNIYRRLNNVVRISNRVELPMQKQYASMLSNILECRARAEFLLDKEIIFHHDTTTNNYYFSLYWERLGLTYDGTNVYHTNDGTQTPIENTEIANIAWEYINNLPEEHKKLYMVLNEPAEETIDLPTLPTFKGTTIYEVGTITQPSNMEIDYYSTVKGE